MTEHITTELRELREHFVASGFDIRLVGGVVRDIMSNNPVKDVDLCTNATPDEQIQIYQQHGYRWIETGLQHGTVTVVLNHVPYEITSLRIDAETDGRHAKVEYTRDWHQDLARRDLTINAMSMTFEGELVDPFGGMEDLKNGVVRFVGNPVDRIREDYLRILRWFRFQCRFGNKNSVIDDDMMAAIMDNASGLRGISRERVWSEIKRIVLHPAGPAIMWDMLVMQVSKNIGLPDYWNKRTSSNAQSWTQSPEVIVAAGMDWQSDMVIKISQDWKWSNAEAAHAVWISRNAFQNRDLRRLIAVDGVSREWVAELAAVDMRDEWERNALVNWVFPEFPVNGDDLIQHGFRPGRVIGETLVRLRDAWADSGYVATKEDLMDMI